MSTSFASLEDSKAFVRFWLEELKNRGLELKPTPGLVDILAIAIHGADTPKNLLNRHCSDEEFNNFHTKLFRVLTITVAIEKQNELIPDKTLQLKPDLSHLLKDHLDPENLTDLSNDLLKLKLKTLPKEYQDLLKLVLKDVLTLKNKNLPTGKKFTEKQIDKMVDRIISRKDDPLLLQPIDTIAKQLDQELMQQLKIQQEQKRDNDAQLFGADAEGNIRSNLPSRGELIGIPEQGPVFSATSIMADKILLDPQRPFDAAEDDKFLNLLAMGAPEAESIFQSSLEASNSAATSYGHGAPKLTFE